MGRSRDGRPAGLIICGALGSGLNTTELVNPLATGLPPMLSIWTAVTPNISLGFVDWANNDRATVERGATVTSNVGWLLACRKEAAPLAGGLTVSRTFTDELVALRTTKGNARTSNCEVPG